MERRDFLKLCSLAGLGVVSSQLPGTISTAQAAPFDKFVVLVNASGGWDHTLFCDPKGNVPNDDGWYINEGFAPGEFGQAGNITYAPVGNNAALFDAYYQNMTVIRGINSETVSHTVGQRIQWSGRMPDNSPCFAALLAAVQGGAKPLAFITNGGYDSTAGVPVSKTRLGDTGSLFPLIFPNDLDPGSVDSSHFHTPDTFARIQEARQARLDAMLAKQRLPQLQRSMGLLYTSRLGMEELKKIIEYLPDDLNAYSNLGRQAAIALAAWKAGLCQVATMSMGGYDTHGNNDQPTTDRLTTLVEGVLSLINRATELGIANQLMIVMGSDFGRTPKYNESMGKDHWTVNSNVIIDLSGQIPGNRVIGSTDSFLRYQKVDPASLQPDPNGVAITQGHIHRWLRKETGIEDHELATMFPVSSEDYLDLSAG